jgi:hypothetical protein
LLRKTTGMRGWQLSCEKNTHDTLLVPEAKESTCSVGEADNTLPFHGSITGSIPVRSTISQSWQVVKPSGSYPEYRGFKSHLCNQIL